MANNKQISVNFRMDQDQELYDKVRKQNPSEYVREIISIQIFLETALGPNWKYEVYTLVKKNKEAQLSEL
jgi:hypothetical protein